MASIEEDDWEFNELDALQAELDALKRALGSTYQQLEGLPGDGESGDQLYHGPEDWTGGAEDADAPSRLCPSITTSREGPIGEQVQFGQAWGAGAGVVRVALEANRRLQAQLQRLLRSVDRAMDRNADMVAHVRALDGKKATALAGGQKGGGMACGSWFWQVDGQPPPPHIDAVQLAPVSEALPLAFKRVPWSEEERRKLAEGVLQMVQEMRLDAALGQLQSVLEAGGAVRLEDYEARSAAVGELTLEDPEVATEADQLSLAQWGVLTQRVQLVGRTPLEARAHWKNAARPALAPGPFSEVEDAVLSAAVTRLGARQWAAVSRELGGRRTPLTCLSRHRTLLLEHAAEERGMGAGLSAELDEGEMVRLEALVQQHNAQWKVIATAFGKGWSGYQLMHVWRRKQQRLAGVGGAEGQAGAQPAMPRRGRWTAEEDDLLLKAMAVHQRKWSKVSQLVPGRSDVQCRERFMNVLNPDVRQHEPWSAQEDLLLQKLVLQYTREGSGKVKWSAVAAELPGRTDKQCALRWQRLQAGDDAGVPGLRLLPAPKRKKPAANAGHGGRGSSRGRGGGAAGGEQVRAAQEPVSEAEAGSEAEGQGAEVAQQAAPSGKGGQRRALKCKRKRKRLAVAELEASSGSRGMVGKRERDVRLKVAASEKEEETETEGEAEVEAIPRRLRKKKSVVASEEAATAGWVESNHEHQPRRKQQQTKPLPGPPEPTAKCMPCTREGAVGRTLKVFWLIDDDTAVGKLYAGKITAFISKTGHHTVAYRTGPEQHVLEEENLVWGSGEVTGPGAEWPEDGHAQADVGRGSRSCSELGRSNSGAEAFAG